MPKVKAVGKHAAILPFRAAGVELVDADDPEAAKSALREIRESGEETLVMIPEDMAGECAAEIALLRQGASFLVLNLPAFRGETGLQRERVRQLVARSLGVDLMGRK
ncbi:MAG: hypothetical protein LBU64_07490 [Planctomycetota bacterium]|jgi:V/A-type H+-transporting ATPase subunit F|nr:hypothetical protein [Planctomycetota bacterium]